MNLLIGRSYGSSNTILLTDKDKHDYIAQLNLKGQLMGTLTPEQKESLMVAVYEKLKEITSQQKPVELTIV